jgi:hypothetical protein
MEPDGELTLIIHGLAVDNGKVRAEVFLQKFRALLDTLKVADKAANAKKAHNYVIVGMEAKSARATLREKVSRKRILPASSVNRLRDVAECIYNGDRNIARFPVELVEALTPWVTGMGKSFSHSELQFSNDNGIRIDDFMATQIDRAVQRVRGVDIQGEKFFAGVALETFDGVIKEIDSRGVLVRGKLILSTGGKELDCVFRPSDVPTLRESFDRRARVEAVAHYDGASLLPGRLDVRGIQVVQVTGDLLKWRGALGRRRQSGGLDE